MKGGSRMAALTTEDRRGQPMASGFTSPRIVAVGGRSGKCRCVTKKQSRSRGGAEATVRSPPMESSSTTKNREQAIDMTSDCFQRFGKYPVAAVLKNWS